MRKSVVGLFLAGMMLFSSTVSASAVGMEEADLVSSEYQETHFQINFADYNVNVCDVAMYLEVKDPVMTRESNDEQENLAKLLEIFETFPDVEENLINEYQGDGELLAVSFTEVPLMYVDGHYERVPVQREGYGYEHSDKNGKGKF